MIRASRPFTNIREDERVVVYPTFGYLVDDGESWRIPILGTIYSGGSISLRKRMMIRLLQRVMRVKPSEVDNDIFQDRIRGFATPTARGRRICIQVGDRVHALQKASNRSGYFQGTLTIDRDEAAEHLIDGEWLRLRVPTNDSDICFEGRAQLLTESGTSVISDIDDTVKHSNVTRKTELLANTFLREFRYVDGMSEMYGQWAGSGVTFHYVSSSPWQLYQPLTNLCTEADFPDGPFHLRAFKLRDHMIRRLLLIRRPGKSKVIRRLIECFPSRRFILIGDSGEKDAEIYASMATRFPEQVAKIYIRQVAARPMDEARCRRAFKKAPAGIWSVFEDASELPIHLPE